MANFQLYIILFVELCCSFRTLYAYAREANLLKGNFYSRFAWLLLKDESQKAKNEQFRTFNDIRM